MRTSLVTILLALSIVAGCGGTAPPAPAAKASPGQATAGGTLALIHERGKLIYAWATWFPYAYRDPKTNEVSGIAISLAKDLAQHMGVDLALTQDNWSTVVGGLQAGRYDIALPMVVSDERAKAVSFTDPVMTNSYTAVLKKENAGRFPTVQSLDRPDVTVAATLGSNGDRVMAEYFKKAKLLHVKGSEEEVLAVESGRADALFTGNDQGTFLLKQYPDLTMLSEGIGNQDISFPVAKGDEAFVAYLNDYIAKIRSDGRLLSFIEQSGLTGAFVPK